MAVTVDVNCTWSLQQTLDWAPELRAMDLLWVEEPIFPAEDWEGLARIRRETGFRIATGENACTEHQFGEMLRAGAADFVQPSVPRSAASPSRWPPAAAHAPRACAWPSTRRISAPATSPRCSSSPQPRKRSCSEYLYIQRDADIFRGLPVPIGGRVAIPVEPGIGMDPDTAVLERFSI